MKMASLLLVAFLLCPVYGQTEEEAIRENIADIQVRLKALRIDEIKADIAKLKRTIAEAKGITPQNPAKETVVVPPDPEILVNILFIDDQGNVPHCYKGVRVSDIVQKEGHIAFMFNGKTISWSEKVVFSYPYTSNEAPMTGTIFLEGAILVANVPPRNVYQDENGSIRYDDLSEIRYPLAPKGSEYLFSQTILKAQ